MKKEILFVCIWILGTTFLINTATNAQRSDEITKVFHESLGEVIDSKENSRFNIFGDITGFTAARIYRVSKYKFRFHIMRNVKERAQIIFPDLSSKKFSELQTAISRRIKTEQKGDRKFDDPVYPIKESKWTETSKNKKLILRDGGHLFVTIKKARNDTLIVKTTGGLQIAVPDTNIANVLDLRGEVRKGTFYRPDPNASRLFFAPTGRELKAGNGYFADYFVLFPTLAFGLTDFFSVSGGVSLIPGAESQLLYFAPKLTMQIAPKVGFGTGFFHLETPDNQEDLNLAFAVSTIGSERSAATFGAGFPLISDSDNSPVVLIGVEKQISNSVKLITENWIFTGKELTVLFSGGIRFFGDRLAADLALITTEEAFGGDFFPFLPYVDFSVFFGK